MVSLYKWDGCLRKLLNRMVILERKSLRSPPLKVCILTDVIGYSECVI